MLKILNKSIDNAIERANLTKEAEKNFYSSVNNLNELGYSYMERNELKKALEIFKLNTLLSKYKNVSFNNKINIDKKPTNRPHSSTKFSLC